MPVVRLNGIDINYVEHGTGETLLLIHNVAANVEAFYANIPDLAQYFRVIACDLRGHGKTTHVDDPKEAPGFYRLESIAEDVRQLLDHLGVGRFFVLGQAYWGASSSAYLLDAVPERVKGMMLVSAALHSNDPGVAPYETMDARSVQNFSHERKRSILAKLEQRQIPVMLLLGADDTHTEPLVRSIRKDVPGAHVSFLPDCGHYIAIENPLDFNLAVSNFVGGCLLRETRKSGTAS